MFLSDRHVSTFIMLKLSATGRCKLTSMLPCNDAPSLKLTVTQEEFLSKHIFEMIALALADPVAQAVVSRQRRQR
jgi:hypothetical protein